MDVRVLGEISMSDAHGPVVVPGGRQRALLALLALRAGQDVDRHVLAGHLLGDDAPRPTASLQVCVSRLRHAMGPARDLLVTTTRGYRLDVEPGQVDALRLAAAVTAGRDGPVDIEALDQVLQEWNGVAFGGADRSPHLELEEQRLLDLRLEGTIALVETLRDQGRAAFALEVVERSREWVTDESVLEPLRSELLGVLGRSAPARRRPPGGAAEATRAADPSDIPAPTPVVAATWPEPLGRAASRPLVGATHQGVVHSVRRPRPPQLTVLVGESGRGKTATAARWARAWGQRGRRVRYLALDDAGASDGALEGLRGEMAGSAPTGTGRPATWAVVVDDAHVLSTRQVELAFDLVRSLVAEGVPLLLTGRPAPPESTWGQLLDWTASAEGCERHDLPALGPTDVRALLNEVGRDLDPQSFDELVDEVWAATAGNAMGVAAVAGLVEAMPSEQRSVDQVPVLLTEVARTQVKSLDPDARSVLLAVAVLDADRVGPSSVGPIATTTTDATIAALKALERADLVATEADGWVRAPHPLYREAVLASLDPLDRRRLHLRASEALAEQGDELGAVLQACRAAPLVDAVGAVRRALAVLTDAPVDLPPSQGLAVAEAARAALVPVPTPPLELRAGVALACAGHLEALGRRDEAERAQSEAFAAVDGTERADLIAAAAIGTEVLGRRPDRTAALDRLVVAADQLEELGATSELQAVLASLIAELFSAGREIPSELAERMAAAVAAGGFFGADELALVRTCVAWSRPIRAVPPPPPRAWSPSAVAAAGGRRRRSLSPTQLTVASALRAGRLDEAGEGIRRLERQVRRSPTPRARWFLLGQSSALELAAGHPDASAELMAEATELGVRYGLSDALQSATASTIARCLADGVHGPAIGDALSPVAAYGTAMTEVSHLPAVVAGAALLAAEAGDPGARDLLWTFLAELTEGRHMPYRVVGLALAAEAAHVLDDHDAAARIVTAFEPYRSELVVLGVGIACFGPATRPLALAAATAGDHGLATEAAEASLEWATHWGAGRWVDRCREAVEHVASNPQLR